MTEQNNYATPPTQAHEILRGFARQWGLDEQEAEQLAERTTAKVAGRLRGVAIP